MPCDTIYTGNSHSGCMYTADKMFTLHNIITYTSGTICLMSRFMTFAYCLGNVFRVSSLQFLTVTAHEATAFELSASAVDLFPTISRYSTSIYRISEISLAPSFLGDFSGPGFVLYPTSQDDSNHPRRFQRTLLLPSSPRSHTLLQFCSCLVPSNAYGIRTLMAHEQRRIPPGICFQYYLELNA